MGRHHSPPTGRLGRAVQARRGTGAGDGAGRTVASNAIAKFVVMGMAGVVSVLTTKLIISNFGLGAYNQYLLLVSMAMWVPFADLGMSAAIMNAAAAAEDPPRDRHLRLVITSAVRVLLCSALVLAGIGIAVDLLGWWPSVLGDGLMAGGGLVATVCVLIFALNLPVAVGPRLLTGLGLNNLQIRAQLIPAPLTLLAVLCMIGLGTGGRWLAVFSFIGQFTVAAVCLVVAARRLGSIVGGALRDVPRRREVPGARTMDVAWPTLVQMVAMPIAFQTDRLLLSHLGTTQQLAQYNLGSQLFGLVIQSITTAGLSLWSVFAKARSRGVTRSPMRMTIGFIGAATAAALVLSALLPFAVPLIADDRLSLDGWLVSGFVLFVAVQAGKQPPGMYMTDAKGLRFQVLPILVLVPLNLALSWWLIEPLGAAGPVWGSVIAVTVCQLVPNVLYVRRDLRRRAA